MTEEINRKEYTEREKLSYNQGLYNGRLGVNGTKFVGYCVLWGAKREGSDKYFTKGTEFGDLNKSFPLHVLADGHSVKIGSAILSRDDAGIFAEIELDKSAGKAPQFVDAINSLVKQGLAYLTTTATYKDYPEGVSHFDEDGAITLWPIFNLRLSSLPNVYPVF